MAGYRWAIARGCDQAFPPPEPLAKLPNETAAGWLTRLTPGQNEELKSWQASHRWHPHQLRHAAATRLRREFGIEAARVILGHSSPAMTDLYAEIDASRAQDVMARIG